MAPDTLNNLLAVSLQAKSIEEFDPKAAIEVFMVSKQH